jgi:hypothetical protein
MADFLELRKQVWVQHGISSNRKIAVVCRVWARKEAQETIAGTFSRVDAGAVRIQWGHEFRGCVQNGQDRGASRLWAATRREEEKPA